MYYIYVLKSKRDSRLYIGSTNNVTRRLLEHNSGKTPSLKKLIPLKLVFQQGFPTRTQARKIELKLKKFKNRKIIEQIIIEQKIRTKA